MTNFFGFVVYCLFMFHGVDKCTMENADWAEAMPKFYETYGECYAAGAEIIAKNDLTKQIKSTDTINIYCESADGLEDMVRP